MSKRFVIIRHAKSSWATLGQADFDRPLNERGKQNAPEMGRRLLQYGLMPDLVLASSSKRTRQTTKAITEAMHFSGKTEWLDKLYHAPVESIENAISTADDQYNTLFIIAHNPGLTQFLIEHGDRFITDNMPTCSIAAFQLDTDSWAGFYTAGKTVIKYDFPKNTAIE